jgi:hypothetical protein
MPTEYGKPAHFSRTMGNVGAHATQAAETKATQTSRGGKSSLAPTQRAIHQIDSAGSRSSSIHPGSRAGLNDASAVHLQSNTSGYAHPSNHNARLSPKGSLVKPSISRTNESLKTSQRTFDRRWTSSSSSSISRLSKLI